LSVKGLAGFITVKEIRMIDIFRSFGQPKDDDYSGNIGHTHKGILLSLWRNATYDNTDEQKMYIPHKNIPQVIAALQQALALLKPKVLSPEEAHGIAATMPETVKGSKAEQFVRHIEAHLTEGQVVVCKICDKTIDEIYDCQNQEQPEAKCRNCGKLFYCEDDYDTLGSVTGLCCPDCGCEGFEYLSQETANEPEKETKKS
jgi:hypothetical protein